MNLNQARQEIDKIDTELQRLINRRMELSKEIAKIKFQNNIPVLDHEREQQILERIARSNPENADAMKLLFAGIMDISRALQYECMPAHSAILNQIQNAQKELPKSPKVACQGVSASYSDFAARAMLPDAQIDFYNGFEDVFKAVSQDKAQLGVVPVENSSAGSVNEVYDLLIKHRFYIVCAVKLHINHCLLGTSGADIEDIKYVYSHPQALLQCSNFLSAMNLQPVSYFNTAGAAKMVAQEKDKTIAAIASEDTARQYGLDVLAKNIQNAQNNSTRFIAVSKKLIIPENADKISLTFSLAHKTGSLYRALSRFAANGLNLTKIESRPIADKNFEYYFYLDFQGNVSNDRTCALLNSLSQEFPLFSFLGNYTEKQL